MLRRSILVASMSVNLFFNIAFAQSVRNPALRKELLDMAEADRQIRRELIRKRTSGALDASDTQRAQSIDTANMTRLKQIIEQYGWPGKSLVEEDGADAAWLIAQHADRDLDFQKKCLALLQEAVSKGEATKAELAYLTGRVRVASAQPVGNPALRKELLDMEEADQRVRRELSRKRASGAPDASEDAAKQSIDTVNRTRLKQIIEQYGWPGKSLVGEDGANAAWLIVQHADRDRDFQKKCLALLREVASKGEASKIDLAYLTDRLLVAEGKPQIYGTQIRRVDGKPSPYPIEDEANVDKRRAELGMGTMADYLKLFR